jgi:hypothetical protein
MSLWLQGQEGVFSITELEKRQQVLEEAFQNLQGMVDGLDQDMDPSGGFKGGRKGRSPPP